MKIYEIWDWKFEGESKGLFATPEKAYEEVEKLLAKGELINPLFTIYEREVK